MTVRISDAIALDLSLAWTAGEVVTHSVAVDMSASKLVNKLTSRHQKSVHFEMGSPTNPVVPTGSRKRSVRTKIQKDADVSVWRKSNKVKKARNVRLVLDSDDEDEDPTYSAITEF